MATLLEVKDLKTSFYTFEGVVKAVDGITYEVEEGETLGLVGESGCGKSVSALSLMRLIPDPPGKITDGEILFEGEDILKIDMDDMRRIRGAKMSMVFQEPMTSLNPVLTVERQLSETLQLHKGMNKNEARRESANLLDRVGIPDPERRVNQYPHQFSGGMRQRVMIAMALSCNPKLIIADEPTTALDVTMQAQILALMKDLQAEFGMAILMITHDLGVIAESCQRVSVMYWGKIVESTTVKELFAEPLHPYTQALLESIPRMEKRAGKLKMIRGSVPEPFARVSGCPFHARCDHAMKGKCDVGEPPELREVEPNHWAACWLYESE